MQFFDSHCHLQLPQFDADRDVVLARMQGRAASIEQSEIGGIVIGTDLETSKQALELAKRHDFLWASVGLHPNDADEWIDISIQMEELAQDKRVVAIGECGLDYFRTGKIPEEREAQKKRFKKQIELAKKLNKPLIIHCREAHDDMLEILTQNKQGDALLPKQNKQGDALLPKVVMHFFTGTGELAQKYLDLGCYLSFPGPITYTDMYDDSIRITPLDKILSETDSPFAAPVPHRGQRNEPAYVADVVRKLAAVKGLAVDEMARQILLNSERVFGLDNI